MHKIIVPQAAFSASVELPFHKFIYAHPEMQLACYKVTACALILTDPLRKQAFAPFLQQNTQCFYSAFLLNRQEAFVKQARLELSEQDRY